MYVFILNDLEHSVFEIPYSKGYRKMRILSGYASSAYLYTIVLNYPEIELDLIIGMAKKDGITKWDHAQFKKISTEHPKITISYQKTSPGIHTKIYNWSKFDLNSSLTFVGSANFSWNGFRDQKELLCEVNKFNIEEVYNTTDPISCMDVRVEEFISIHDIKLTKKVNEFGTPEMKVAIKKGSKKDSGIVELNNLEHIELPLLIANNTAIHEKAGLNWGQREKRERNQAYIPVPTIFNRDNPGFFPPKNQSFTLITDDGEQLICKMAQANRKAIHTTENNSIMGKYFRERLGVPLGQKVEVTDVLKYTRTSVTIYKVDAETYIMDFSVNAS